MATYFFILSVPSFLAFVLGRRFSRLSVFITFLIFTVFVGFRDKVGSDWWSYDRTHFLLNGESFYSVLIHLEPLSYVLFWFSENSGFHTLLTNIIAASILMLGVLSFSRRTSEPWLAVVAATPYLIIVFSMSGIRQAMAVGVFLLVLSKWEKSTILSRTVGIVVASMFHTSALITGLFVVYDLKVRTLSKIIGGTILGVLGFFVTIHAGSFDNYHSVYVEDSSKVISAGSLLHIALIAIPAILGLLFVTRLKYLVHNYQLFLLGLFGTLIVAGLYGLSTTVTSRLTLYLYFVPMMVYPAMISMVIKENRDIMRLLIILAHFGVLMLWLQYSNNSSSYIPYQNILATGF